MCGAEADDDNKETSRHDERDTQRITLPQKLKCDEKGAEESSDSKGPKAKNPHR